MILTKETTDCNGAMFFLLQADDNEKVRAELAFDSVYMGGVFRAKRCSKYGKTKKEEMIQYIAEGRGQDTRGATCSRLPKEVRQDVEMGGQ